MKGAARAGRWAAATLLALPAVAASLIQGSARAATPACGLEIAGIWKSADAEQLTLLSFTTEGWANVLGGSRDQRAEDFDILAQVRYELDDPRRPRRLNFTARHGSDLFPAGESSWELVAYDDHSFAVRTEDAQSLWTRVQTHRYFLTFAYRPAESAERGADGLVAWTTLDGRRTVVEAFGVRPAPDGRKSRFSPIMPDFVTEARGAASRVGRRSAHRGQRASTGAATGCSRHGRRLSAPGFSRKTIRTTKRWIFFKP
jgi:hypothetical protein